MSFPHPLPRTFRYLEWIYILAHLGMSLSRQEHNLSVGVWFYGLFFILSWLYPIDRPYWQRYIYILLAIGMTLVAKWFGIDIELFLFFYVSKSYFLLKRRATILLTMAAGLLWTTLDYLAEVDRSNRVVSPVELNAPNSLQFLFFSLLVYAAASLFVLVFSDMVVKEEKSRRRAEALAEQVESLATDLERTRIAREIHDSLGHTLTDLDMQLAVAQQLRSHDLDQAFRAIDTAKVLTYQCIEDVSQALDRMRQSDFDLNQALSALMEQISLSASLQIEWEVNLPRLQVHQSYQVYCIVKEAMINVQKHAHASQVNFYGGSTNQGVVLNLKDNGRGFDPTNQQGGFGIQGMMERVQLLGGQFKLSSIVGQGTQIQVILPL